MRNAIRHDLIQFGLPALVVFAAGLILSGTRGWLGFAATVGSLFRWRGAQPPPVWEPVGLFLVASGFVIAGFALATLRFSYSSSLVIREGHRLVTEGIYRLVRHPIYLGVLMVCLGIAVHAGSPLGTLTMAALVPIFLNRIRLEEALLVEEFGEAYRRYQESTSKLVPFVY